MSSGTTEGTKRNNNVGNYKLARLARYDDVVEQFTLEYIDESVQRRRLSSMTSWHFVPPLLQQELSPRNPMEIECEPNGILWDFYGNTHRIQ